MPNDPYGDGASPSSTSIATVARRVQRCTQGHLLNRAGRIHLLAVSHIIRAVYTTTPFELFIPPSFFYVSPLARPFNGRKLLTGDLWQSFFIGLRPYPLLFFIHLSFIRSSTDSGSRRKQT